MTIKRCFLGGVLSACLIGTSASAADATNQPPRISIVSPPDGAVFVGSPDVLIVAGVKDTDGTVQTVEFFADGTSLGVVTNRFPGPVVVDPPGPSFELQAFPDDLLDFVCIEPFHLVWRDAPAGHHVLTAVATDNLGASTTSAAVEITVLDHSLPPVVTVVATDPIASEGGINTASFTVHRTGPTNSDLVVNYHLSGTASNGVDYAELPSSVTIVAGKRTADVLIAPIDDTLIEGPETVVLILDAPPCPDPTSSSNDCYWVGRCDRALAVIRDNDRSNVPPVVKILNPEDGEIFRAGSDIRLTAGAWDFDGSIKSVEFFEGTNSLGVVTNPAPFSEIWNDNTTLFPLVGWLSLYSLTWSNVSAGDYVVTAVATDNAGAETISKPVEIKVVELHPPPVVTIKATDPDATEIPVVPPGLGMPQRIDTATFTVYRTDGTNADLTVYYRIGGTAQYGVDYVALQPFVTIPAGAASADIVVEPIDDLLVEGDETVSLELVYPTPPLRAGPFPPPPYLIGDPGAAKAVIHDNDIASTNLPPTVRLISPQDGQIFAGPTDIHLVAYAQDPEDGFSVKVEFFEGTNSLGFGTFVPSLCPSPYCPNFSLLWSNVPPGTYTLTARATDQSGASSVSDPAHIKVVVLQSHPVVTIAASDPTATEQSLLVGAAPDTATFLVHRTGGDLNNPLTVLYQIGGTASNGVDYNKLSGEVTIPAHSETAEIVINPIDDDLVEGTETVVLELLPGCPPCLFADPPCDVPETTNCYMVGVPGEAVAFIRDNDQGNTPPHVQIVNPHVGDAFPALSDIEIDVKAQDPDGWVHTVEFFANDVKIGEQSIEFIVAPPPNQEQMFSLMWSNVTAGRYVLTARATDDQNGTATSAPVAITVGDVSPPVPMVSIVATDPFAAERCATNGTNTATFRIFRTGPTNTDLVVFYSVHGTASNGVDYVEIGNSAIIPAGRHSAKIDIVPIDDNLDEGIETVVLHLEPDPSLSPIAHYQVGRPDRAAAIIVDNDAHHPPCLRLPDGSFHLCVEKPDGFAFSLESSEDLAVWTPLCTNVVTGGTLQFVDPEAPEHTRRFYRIVPQSDYVPEE